MDDQTCANRALWDWWTELHSCAEAYDIAGFRAGKESLRPVELAELGGEVAGKRLLHLMCNFGLDTLSWARRGAIVTGVDFSERAIALARSLSRELSIPATFVCADIGQLPAMLNEQFDVVYTSYGVLHWLPDLGHWAAVIARFLAPGGISYIVDTHPFLRLFDTSSPQLSAAHPYFGAGEPVGFVARGSYAVPEGDGRSLPGYMWDHGIGEVITALALAGLRIEYLHEYPFHARAVLPDMDRGADGWWRLTASPEALPLLFSLRAIQPPRISRRRGEGGMGDSPHAGASIPRARPRKMGSSPDARSPPSP